MAFERLTEARKPLCSRHFMDTFTKKPASVRKWCTSVIFFQRLLAPRAAGLIYFLLALSAGLRSLMSLPLPLAAVQVHHARSIKGCEREASNLLWGHLSLDLDGAARLVRTRWSL